MPAPTEVTLPKEKIQFIGVFDYDELYRKMQAWYKEREYEFREKAYKQKPGASEIELEWEGYRNETSYVRFWVNIYVHIYDLQDVEIIHEGVKKKMNKARMQMEISGRIELDWQKEFDQTKYLRRLRDFFHTFVFSETKDLGMYWDKLYYHIYGFHTAIKNYLDLQTKYSAY